MKKLLESTIKKIIKYTLFAAMTLLVLLAVFISVARFFMPSLDQYEQQVENIIAKELQLNVQFESFTADWYRFGPALKVTGITLSSHAGEIVTEIDALYVSFSLLNSIAQRKLIPAYLNVVGVNFDLEQAPDNTFKLVNFPAHAESSSGGSDVIVETLKKFNSITIRRSRINFQDALGQQTPIYLRRLVFSRSGQHHQLEVMLNLLNHPTRLEMMANIDGDLAKPKQLKVQGYIELDNAALGQYLKPYQFEGYRVNDGLADVKAWVEVHEGRLQQLQADMHLQEIELYSPKQDKLLNPFDLQNAFLWARQKDNDWTLSGQDLNVRIDEAPLPMLLISKFELNHEKNAYQFVGKEVIVEHVSQALLYSGELPKKQQTQLEDLNAKGFLNDLTLNWDDVDWQIGSHFESISYQGSDGLPSVNNLSGELMATPHSGKISLDTEDAHIDYTPLFPQVFEVSTLTGDIFWHRTPTFWQLNTDNMSLENEGLKIESDFIIKGGDTLDTHMDINVAADEMDSLQVYQYLPVGVFSDYLSNWLKTSIGPGHLEQVTIKAQGLAKDFPFFDEASSGVFRIHTHLHDQELTFDPTWPKLEKMNGQFLLLGPRIQVALDSAQIFQTDLYGVSADINLTAKATSWLNIRGESITQAQHAIDFLKVSPLDKSISNSLDLFTFNMPVTLTLDLHIPLNSDTDKTKINGLVQVSEGDAILKDWDLQFSNINGVVGFTESGAYSQGIHAQLLGGPMLLTITPEQKGKEHLTHWKALSKAQISQVKEYFPNVLWNYMEGGSEFSANFTTGGNVAQKGFDFVIESDLKGTAIHLPAPIGKTADQATPIRYITTLGLGQHTLARLQYNKIDALAAFSQVDHQQVLTGGKVQLGGPLPSTEIPTGITVAGTLPDFSFDIWHEFLTTLKKPEKKTENKNTFFDDVLKQIKQVDVSITHLEAYRLLLNNAQVFITQTPDQWNLKLKSKEWAGRITLPHAPSSPINLNFDFCTIDSTQKKETTSGMDPRTIPALTFICKDFIYNKKDLGAITFDAVPEPLGLKLSRVSMTRANDSINAAGRWWFEQNVQQTRFAGELKSTAIDKTLLLADIKSTIIGSKSQANFSLSWPGNPFDFAVAHLSGEVDVRLNSGVLVDVSPGFGRILSLLSIQSLQRRLRLDFSDVFKKGFSFDSISALITINNGKAHSDNLLLKAPTAEVKMQGDVNLATKQLDLTALVIAHISGSLPLAATIASGGNPIVGALGVGVWAVDKIVKSQAGDSMGSTYHITGTWEKPIVKGK